MPLYPLQASPAGPPSPELDATQAYTVSRLGVWGPFRFGPARLVSASEATLPTPPSPPST